MAPVSRTSGDPYYCGLPPWLVIDYWERRELGVVFGEIDEEVVAAATAGTSVPKKQRVPSLPRLRCLECVIRECIIGPLDPELEPLKCTAPIPYLRGRDARARRRLPEARGLPVKRISRETGCARDRPEIGVLCRREIEGIGKILPVSQEFLHERGKDPSADHRIEEASLVHLKGRAELCSLPFYSNVV